MCGIFGIISNGKRHCTKSQAHGLIELFYKLSESRGKEAAGGALMRGNQIDVVKESIRGRNFLRLPQTRKLSNSFIDSLSEGKPFVFTGHTRMVTNGSSDVHDNNQPVIHSGLVVIHNGIIVNDAQLWPDLPTERTLEVDTEVMLALVEHNLRKGNNFIAAAAEALRQIKGANSFALLSSDHEGLLLSTTNGSMYIATAEQSGFCLFASERSILEQIIEKSIRGFCSLTKENVAQVQPGELVSIPCFNPRPSFGKYFGVLPDDIEQRKIARSIMDHGRESTKIEDKAIIINNSRLSQIESLMKIDWDAIKELRRCNSCLLPETFPFIEYDENGICNICKHHKNLELRGQNTLRQELDAIRKSNSTPEILMPLSGGRDSCYGLHKVVKEYNMNAVAYTYDWGMVTDLARRNISRMCGELGVEHILISADIKRKRENIRKNVSAWLRRPHLGTIPLFMAGDKQYFYYANMLKKEMDIPLTIMSINPLERTDFKVGFCGIDELYHKKHYHDPHFFNKMRLLGFYTGQFLSNSGYFNDSLIDSAFAYFSYYMISKDYTSIYDYLPWHEEEIESVLLGQYDWEISPDTKSTWRIGDGTAAFYNYIYVKVAGFSENDTFRSNQIREGQLTREEALHRIYEDNISRVESLAWYFDAIGLDATDAIRLVNQMRPLYAV